MKYLILILLLINSAIANDRFLDSVKRTTWNLGKNNVDVVWIEDDKFPKFTASIYFKNGALNDSVPGETQMAFDQITSGTSKQTQREISEFFDFYGVNLRHSVTHEYSVLSIQALTKDIKPVIGKICELFNDAQYPKDELLSHISRTKSQLKNLVTSHSNLADRVFRKISLKNTPYAEPVEGTLESLDKITPSLLKAKLESLKKTKKVLYLAGPSDVKEMKDIIKNNCNWSSEIVVGKKELKKPSLESAIYLVDVPNANQAQIRVGRYLVSSEFDGKHDYLNFMSNFLGGGFTSKLVQELRVKRGLTYSAGAYASMLGDYGRAGIVTFSKNETAAEAISIVRDVLTDLAQKKIEMKEFTHQKNHQIGGFAFGFEQTNALIGQVMLYDHQNRPLEQLINFPHKIEKMTLSELASTGLETFPWDKLTIVVVGDKSLARSLSRIRPVRVVNYEDYL